MPFFAGVQKPGRVGVMSYLTPLGNGVNRGKFDWWGWGAADNAFWCCYGTSVESFAKLADSIYFASNSTTSTTAVRTPSSAASAPPLTLTVAQYIASNLSWSEAGLEVTQNATYTADASALQANFTFAAVADDAVAGGGSVRLRLRVPPWAVLSRSRVEIVPSAAPPPPITSAGWLELTVAAGTVYFAQDTSSPFALVEKRDKKWRHSCRYS